jgi:hypothetical protein
MLQALKGIGAFAFLLAVFMAGITISNNNWSSYNATLQTDLRHTQEERDKLRAELGATKAEVLGTKTSQPTLNPTVATKKVNQEDVTVTSVNVLVGESASVFDGALTISVVAIVFEGNPYRYKVVATVGGPGIENVSIDHADVGYVASVKSKDSFEVRVVSISSSVATFSVRKSQSPELQTPPAPGPPSQTPKSVTTP